MESASGLKGRLLSETKGEFDYSHQTCQLSFIFVLKQQ